MKIIVCIKQVPDTAGGVKFKPDGTLDRGAMLAIMNPDDKAGLEAALRIKDEIGAEVTVMTMGLPKADAVLREALAMGADKAILMTDRRLGGADTWATSSTIAAGIRRFGDYDLIITGRQAIDGDTAQVGPQIAEHLGIPVISYAQKIKVNEAEHTVEVERQYDDRYHVLKAKMPCLITALSELNTPRYMTPKGIWDACDAEIITWNRDDLETLKDEDMGLAGSPTKIAKASDKVRKGKGTVYKDLDPDQGAKTICDALVEQHYI
ncbi:MAG: electron transfer flavoprotein subunit beta/FixA family protein [Lachnospiraceae bacterium]|nr:electron transfer flavoprotein subunit beta/FixA family protein [Lachnospiraceae bacterium]